MSTDFLLATKKDAKAIARTDNPTSRWPGFATGLVMECDLENLFEILTGDKDAELDFDVLCCDESGDGPMVSTIPNQLIDALINLAPNAYRQAAKKWAKTEEFRGLWEVDEVEGLLHKLCDFANRAKAEEKLLLSCCVAD